MDSSEVIDLTNSFTLADHCVLSNLIIDLATDDSFCSDSTSKSIQSRPSAVKSAKPTLRQTLAGSKKKKVKGKQSLSGRKSDTPQIRLDEKENNFGGCPICWDDLGKNPLASTKCGHVYCIKCIQEYLKVEKRCPTCRQSLKGSSAYHPLYLSRE